MLPMPMAAETDNSTKKNLALLAIAMWLLPNNLKFSVVIAIFHYLLKRKISGFSVSLRLMGLKELGLPPCA